MQSTVTHEVGHRQAETKIGKTIARERKACRRVEMLDPPGFGVIDFTAAAAIPLTTALRHRRHR